jgi:DNA (cytosine-5)-methyltransferase 1
MRAISLFSGVGGLDRGLELAGIDTVLQAESDPWCRAVLERHFPGAERVSDVRNVGASVPLAGGNGRYHVGRDAGFAERTASASSHDLVHGGFPCQDVSVAGKRAGFRGERSSLWFEFNRVLSALRPRWTVIENVPGLLSSHSGRDFGTILSGLVDLGYGVAWRTLDARHFGVPQRRRRVFIVGCLGDAARAAAVLAVCEGCSGDSAAGGEAGEGVAYGLAASPRGTGDGHGNAWNTTYLARGQGPGVSLPGDPMFTLDSTGAQAFGSRQGVRRLTPLECERLMGWPETQDFYTIVVCQSEQQKNRVRAAIQSHKKPLSAGNAANGASSASALSAALSFLPNDPTIGRPAAVSVAWSCEGGAIRIDIPSESPLSASTAESNGWFGHLGLPADSALLAALTTSTLAQTTHAGRAESLRSNGHFGLLANGEPYVLLSGSEITELANAAGSIIPIAIQRMKHTTSEAGSNSLNSASILTILSSCVASAISGHIPAQIRNGDSYVLRLALSSGWTRWTADGREVADSIRYRMCGNGVVSPVAEWIGWRLRAVDAATD